MIVAEVPAQAGAVAAAKRYLRIEDGASDALLEGLAASAVSLGEAFTRQVLLSREVSEYLPAGNDWRRLERSPVRSIDGVAGLAVDGTSAALPVGAYAIDIDANGDGWVRLTGASPERRVLVTYQAGMAADLDGLPPAIGQGISRLIAHLYTHRDAIDEPAGPPAAVAALWRPWRRMQLR
jgi:uncharacterized phiE125 gp8 family phage protein